MRARVKCLTQLTIKSYLIRLNSDTTQQLSYCNVTDLTQTDSFESELSQVSDSTHESSTILGGHVLSKFGAARLPLSEDVTVASVCSYLDRDGITEAAADGTSQSVRDSVLDLQ